MILGVVAIAMVLGMVVIPAVAENDGILGNGAPQCKLLGKLNIIGVKDAKSDNMNDKGGSTIFVDLDGTNAIYLANSRDLVGEDVFEVLDKTAMDEDGAEFMLPPPDFSAYNVTTGEGKTDTQAEYTVLVRPLGKPGGMASITTCAELVDTELVSSGLLSKTFVRALNKTCTVNPDALASVEQVSSEMLTRPKGKSEFTNVTAELTSIVLMVLVDDDGDLETTDDQTIEYVRVPIFDSILDGEYWEYDNDGLKLCQVRFYDCPTDVSLDDGDWNNLPE